MPLAFFLRSPALYFLAVLSPGPVSPPKKEFTFTGPVNVPDDLLQGLAEIKTLQPLVLLRHQTSIHRWPVDTNPRGVCLPTLWEIPKGSVEVANSTGPFFVRTFRPQENQNPATN